MSRRRKWSRIVARLVLLAGILVLVFPYISQFVYQLQVDQIIGEFDERMENDDNLDELYQSIVVYNENLFKEKQEGLADPFFYEQAGFDFDGDIFGYLSIPKMDIRLPIYLGATEENLRKGAAHLTQTSLPVGGINTNAVIAAHRGMGTKAMFRNIERLEQGDKFMVTNFRETLMYKVVGITVILPTDIEKIRIQEGRDLVTLITCHPYRHNYQRYLVYGERVIDSFSASKR